MSSDVQFRSLDALIQGFNSCEAEAWSLWAGKRLIKKGMGSEDLRKFCTSLNGSNSAYTLKYYEGIEDLDELKPNTPDDGSFNFRLNDENLYAVGTQALNQQQRISTQERLDKLETILLSIHEKLEGEEEEAATEEKTLGDIIINYLEDPNKLATLGNLFRRDVSASAERTAAIGNVVSAEAETPTATWQTNEDKLNKVAAALDTLEKQDKEIVEHLEKLALLSTKQPGTFKILLQTLNNTKL